MKTCLYYFIEFYFNVYYLYDYCIKLIITTLLRNTAPSLTPEGQFRLSKVCVIIALV